MRISSDQQFQQGVDNILRQQAKLNETQEQLASGNRILTPSDDPSASTQLIKMSALIARNKQYDRNVVFAQNQLQLTESKLQNGINVLQRVRELVVQAGNPSRDDTSRSAIASEIDNKLKEMLDVANSRDASGEYIFSGYNASTRPFVLTGTGYVYAGDQGERYLQIAEDLQVQVRESGAAMFQTMPEGDGRLKLETSGNASGTATLVLQSSLESEIGRYSIEFSGESEDKIYKVTDESGDVIATGAYISDMKISFNNISVAVSGEVADGDRYQISPAGTQDVFTMLAQLSEAIAKTVENSGDRADLTNYLGQSLEELDGAMEVMVNARSSIGSRLQQLDTRSEENKDAAVRYERAVSELRDLDYASAVSRLNMQMTGLQAAQQAYIKVQGLSLFNFLR